MYMTVLIMQIIILQIYGILTSYCMSVVCQSKRLNIIYSVITLFIYIFCVCMFCVKLIKQTVLESLIRNLVSRHTSRTFFTCTCLLLKVKCCTKMSFYGLLSPSSHVYTIFYLCTIEGVMIHRNFISWMVKVSFLVHYFVVQKWY